MTKLIHYCADQDYYSVLRRQGRSWEFAGNEPRINPAKLRVVPGSETVLELPLGDVDLGALTTRLEASRKLCQKALEHGEEAKSQYVALGRFKQDCYPRLSKENGNVIARQTVVLLEDK